MRVVPIRAQNPDGSVESMTEECLKIQSKLKGNGDIWSVPELTHEEKMHVASCDSCSKAWAKRTRIEGTNSFW